MRSFRQVPAALVFLLLGQPSFAATPDEASPGGKSLARQAVAGSPLAASGESSAPGDVAAPAGSETAADRLPFVPSFLSAQPDDRSTSRVPQSGGSCFYACYDLDESSQFCPPGKNFALEATGPWYRCSIVGGGVCISSGCSVHISSCSGFAASC